MISTCARNRPSPGRAGAAYSPFDWLALYASYGTGFKPNASTFASQQRTPPEYARQVEGGVRFLHGEKLILSAAGYKIWKRNVTVPGEMDTFETAGRASSLGAELDLTAKPLRQLALVAGAAYTDAVYDQYSTMLDEDLSGNRIPFVPKYMGNLWIRVMPSEALGIGVGGRVMGRQFADDENTLPLGAYWLMDAAFWYEVGPVRATFTVNNLLKEKDYFVSSIYQQLTPGPQREFLAQLHVNI